MAHLLNNYITQQVSNKSACMHCHSALCMAELNWTDFPVGYFAALMLSHRKKGFDHPCTHHVNVVTAYMCLIKQQLHFDSTAQFAMLKDNYFTPVTFSYFYCIMK